MNYLKWAYGAQTVDWFADNGRPITNNDFLVSEIGIHTIYYETVNEDKRVYTFNVTKEMLPSTRRPITSFSDNILTVTFPDDDQPVDLRYDYLSKGTLDDFNSPNKGFKVYKNGKIYIDSFYFLSSETDGYLTLYYKFADGVEEVYPLVLPRDEIYKSATNVTLSRLTNGELAVVGNGIYLILDKETGLAIDVNERFESRFDTVYSQKVFNPNQSSNIGYKFNYTEYNALPALDQEKFKEKSFMDETERGITGVQRKAKFRMLSYHELNKWIDTIMPAVKVKWSGFTSDSGRWTRLWTRTQVSDSMAVWAVNQDGEPESVSMVADANKTASEYEGLGLKFVNLDVLNMYQAFKSDKDYPYFSPTVTGKDGVGHVKFEGKIRYRRVSYRVGQLTLADMQDFSWNLDQGTFKIEQVGWYTIYTEMLDGSGHIEHIYFDETALLNYRATFWGTGSRVKFKFTNSLPPDMSGTSVQWDYGVKDVAYFSTTRRTPVFPATEKDAIYMDLLGSSEHTITICVTNGADKFVEVYDIPSEYYNAPDVSVTYDRDGVATVNIGPNTVNHINDKRWASGNMSLTWFTSNPSNGTVIASDNQFQIPVAGTYTVYSGFDNYFGKVDVFNAEIYPLINIEDAMENDILEIGGVNYIYINNRKILTASSQISMAYDTSGSTTFNPLSSTNIAYYLNNEYLNSLPSEVSSKIEESDWTTGATAGTDIVRCKIALLDRNVINSNTNFNIACDNYMNTSQTTAYYFWIVNKSTTAGRVYRRTRGATSYSSRDPKEAWGIHPAFQLLTGTKVRLIKRYS